MACVRILGPRPMVLAAAQQSTPPPPAARGPAFDIRPTQVREDLHRAAWLRADAYYEDRSVGRFKASFVKQFAGQELYSLLRRTQGAQPECIALVAAAPGTYDSSGGSSSGGRSSEVAGPGSCIGTLDVRLLDPDNPYSSCSWPDGVPREAAAEDPGATSASNSGSTSATPGGTTSSAAAAVAAAAAAAAYVSNVVVAPAKRGRGLGRQLVAAGLAAARERWGVARVYCHVEIDNEAALALYLGTGFAQLGEELEPAEEGLAKRLLLCRPLGED